jgi:hypothetical protein
MKHLIISLLLAGGFIALSTMETSAVVCARGVYRAGCAGPTAPWSLPVLLPVLWLLRRTGPLSFAAGCTDNPTTHEL